VIRTIKDQETKRLWDRKFSRKLQRVEKVARIRLAFLHRAQSLLDLRLLGLRLETLKGDRRGQHSIRINEQYRICFVWKSGDAYDVEIVDYH
jgi:toxin HigB-1